ncbi:CG7557 [Drosophila busckii]|uniref:CG7557 n=1 Tax=Drosophila busckii TaxID=30019 RepID=A0A0M4EYR9_DROBS|nr:uncharacterized protein LOC108599045 [Drosophila busckii]ALC43700.1 CG7557 [Drosophila busckii]
MPNPSTSHIHTLHPGYAGDFEDPRRCGILHNTSCRLYREKLSSNRHGNMIQGLLIVTSVALVLAMLLFHSQEQQTEAEPITESSSMLETLYSNVYAWLASSPQQQQLAGAREFSCQPHLDSRRIFRHVGRQVLNQELGLARLERALQSERPFRAVALLGPPGVGKTLTALALRQHYPWPENVHSYSWSTYVPDEAQKFNLLRGFAEQLSNCGQNLLIIDNLSTCDYGIVPVFNQLLLERNQTVLVLYIFNLDIEYYWDQFELLQQLPMDTTIVNYRAFGREELTDCLDNELRLEQRVLKREVYERILQAALPEVHESGCKSLRQLLLQHGLA